MILTLYDASDSIKGTCGYGPGSRDVGQQNHHQRLEELPQVSSLSQQLHVFHCQESSLPPQCFPDASPLLVSHSAPLMPQKGRRHEITVNYNFSFVVRCLSEPLMTFKLHKDFILAVSKLWKMHHRSMFLFMSVTIFFFFFFINHTTGDQVFSFRAILFKRSH